MKPFILLGSMLLFAGNSAKAQNSISGYVISLETGKPVAHAIIILNDRYNLTLKDSIRVTSDSTGFYKIRGIKAGYYIINAWNTYHVIDQNYAMVIESDKFKVDHNIDIDFVFSKNAFKMELNDKYHPRWPFKPQKRNPDLVARQADQPQLYINSKRANVGAYFIEQIYSAQK